MSGRHDDALLPKKAIAILCCIEDERNFGGYRVEQDGFYVVPMDTDALHTMTPEERAPVEAWHPTGRLNEPALSFPCTLGQLRAFAEHSLPQCLDEESVDEVVADYALNVGSSKGDAGTVGSDGAAIGESIVRIKRAALINKYCREWPSIEDDLRHSNENGLRTAAKLPDEHGYWNETAVVRWGSERGKLATKTQQAAPKLDALTLWGLQRPD